METKRKGQNILIGVLCAAVVLLSVGYASLSATLNINGSATVKQNTWGVQFQNTVTPTANSNVTATSLTRTSSSQIDFEVTLAKPGDIFEFTAVIENTGTIDADGTYTLTGLDNNYDGRLVFTLTGLTQNETIAHGATKTVTVRVEYNAAATTEPIYTDGNDIELNLAVNFTFVQHS